MPKSIQSDHEVRPEEVYSLEELLEQAKLDLDNLDSLKIRRTPPHILASFLNRLSVEDCRTVLRKVPDLDASEILAEMDADASADIVAAMREWRALRILEEFEPDDAADLISELDDDVKRRLLSKLSPETSKKVLGLLKYPADTAGGVMSPNVITVLEGMTVDQAIEEIRKNRHEEMHTSYVYVVDNAFKLKGVFTMETLILADATDEMTSIMTSDLQGVCSPYEDREKVALAMGELNLFDLPVVDDEGRLLGIVEHDDVIDIIQTEATEDFQKLVGAGADEDFHDKVSYSLRRRGPWLVVNLLTALAAAAVVSLYRSQIESITLLAVFMPAIASLGGNTGAQTLAVAIRSLATGDLKEVDSLRICVTEGLKGMINGVLIGILSSIVVYLFTRQIKMSIVVFLAMIMNMALGGLAGAVIPLLLKRFGFDPAQSSSIFLTGMTDVCGFFIFLSLGAWLLF